MVEKTKYIDYIEVLLIVSKVASNDLHNQVLVWKYILYLGTRHCFACSMVAPRYIVDFNLKNGA